jgi:imidazolonepropionase-like amidohydrolase
VTEDCPLILWDARLLDGARVAITIADGRIADVDLKPGATPPAGALDARGCVVLPGLIDVHTHVVSDTERSPGFGPPSPRHGEPPRPEALRWFVLARAAEAWLAGGLTTIRDVGSFDDEAITLRTAIDLGLADGPRIVSCGRIVSATSPGGRIFGSMYEEADGPWEVRRAVRRQLRRGADFIKIMATGARSVVDEDPEPAQLLCEEVVAAVDEAHRMGVRVAAHAEGLDGVRVAVEAGVDTIEHGLSLHRAPELLDVMAARGIVLVPTLSTFHDLTERFADEFAPALVEQARRQLEEAQRTVVAAARAGVTMAMGYDSGPPGANALELVRLADAGLGVRGAIAAATGGGAAALGRPDLGVLSPGAVADLIVVDRDPLAEPSVLTDPAGPRLVIRAGRIVVGSADAVPSLVTAG